jgi:cytochrome c oxidase assembly protein Cox11
MFLLAKTFPRRDGPQDVQKGRRHTPFWYVESLSDARTKLTAFFNILPRMARHYTGGVHRTQ